MKPSTIGTNYRVYKIVAEVDGKPATPDLRDLEKSLIAQGYFMLDEGSHLDDLFHNPNEHIHLWHRMHDPDFRRLHVGIGSHVRVKNGDYELVADNNAKWLHTTAEEYTPKPLLN